MAFDSRFLLSLLSSNLKDNISALSRPPLPNWFERASEDRLPSNAKQIGIKPATKLPSQYVNPSNACTCTREGYLHAPRHCTQSVHLHKSEQFLNSSLSGQCKLMQFVRPSLAQLYSMIGCRRSLLSNDTRTVVSMLVG